MRTIIGVFLTLQLLSCGRQHLWVKGKVQQGAFNTAIPVEVRNGLVFIEVFIEGEPYNFLLDTGAPTLIGTDVAAKLGLKTKYFGTVTDSYQRKNRLAYTILKQVSLEGVSFVRQGALVANLRAIPTFECLDIDGLLGANIMRNACWQMDYETEVLRIADDCSGFELAPNAISLPFWVNNQGTPKLHLNLGGNLPLANITLDFGSSSGLTLDFKTVAGQFTPQESVLYTTGVAGVGLYGVQEDSVWFMPPTSLITPKGDTLLAALPVRVKRDGSRLFGTQLLQEFRSTIDWKRQRLTLEPRGRTAVVWLTHGCKLQPVGEVLEVAQLVYPSAAIEAGLAIGDTVVTLNELPVSATDFCEARALFEAGVPVRLGVRRGDVELEILLERKDAFRFKETEKK